MEKIKIVLDYSDKSNPLPRFIEIEDEKGKSIDIGIYSEREDGYSEIEINLSNNHSFEEYQTTKQYLDNEII